MRLPNFAERNPIRLAIVGTTVVVLALALALSSSKIHLFDGRRTYEAVFTEAGGLMPGDGVYTAGVEVGQVDSVRLVTSTVRVDFSVTDRSLHLGNLTRASIVSVTVLGRRGLMVQSAGSHPLSSGSSIPLERTTPPYDVTAALSDLTDTLQQVDTTSVARSLQVLSDTFRDTPASLHSALIGVTRMSQTIADRNDQLQALLAHTNSVTGVLADRRGEVQRLLSDGKALLEEVNSRRDQLNEISENVSRAADQIHGLVKENDTRFGPALDQINGLVKLLNSNRDNLNLIADRLPGLIRTLGEVVSGTPMFGVEGTDLFAPTNAIPGFAQLISGGKVK